MPAASGRAENPGSPASEAGSDPRDGSRGPPDGVSLERPGAMSGGCREKPALHIRKIHIVVCCIFIYSILLRI